jgi:hypothetical protein
VESQSSLSCSQDPTSGPCAEPDEYSSYPHSPFLCAHLIQSSHLCLVFPGDLFNSLDRKFVRIIHLAMHATFPTHLIFYDMIIPIFVKITNYETSHCLIFSVLRDSYFLGPNTLFNSLFSHTINLCSSLTVRDQVHSLTNNKWHSFMYFNVCLFNQQMGRREWQFSVLCNFSLT